VPEFDPSRIAPLSPTDSTGEILPNYWPGSRGVILWAQPPIETGRPFNMPPTDYDVGYCLTEDDMIRFRHAVFNLVGSQPVQMETTATVFYSYVDERGCPER